MSTLESIDLQLQLINNKLNLLNCITANIDPSTYKLWKIKFHYDKWKPLMSAADKIISPLYSITNDPNEQDRIVEQHQDIWTKYHKLGEIFNEIFNNCNDSETKPVSNVIDPSHSDGNITNSDIKVETSVPPKEETTLADTRLPIVAVTTAPLDNSNYTCNSLCNNQVEPLVELHHDNRSNLSDNEVIAVAKFVEPTESKVSSENLALKLNYDFNIDAISNSKYASTLQNDYPIVETRIDSNESSKNTKVSNRSKPKKWTINNHISSPNINPTVFSKLYVKYNYRKIIKFLNTTCRSETNDFRYSIEHTHSLNESNKRNYANNSKFNYSYPILPPSYKTFMHMNNYMNLNIYQANSFISKRLYTHRYISPHVTVLKIAILPMCTLIQINVHWGKTPEHRTKIWNSLTQAIHNCKFTFTFGYKSIS